LQKSANNANTSFKKVLPTHSQLQEEDEEELPRFGAQQMLDNQQMHDDINDSVSKLFDP
jgi:hypothetical protein